MRRVDQNRFQLSLSLLLFLPFLVAPLFLGVAIGTRDLASNQNTANYMTAVLVVYVFVFCGFAIRQFDRGHDFRRFPFRGSLLLGIAAGTLAGIQFALGIAAAAWSAAIAAPRSSLNGQEIHDLAGIAMTSLIGGMMGGGYLGLLIGGAYCLVRHLLPNRSKVIPKSRRPHAWRRSRDAAVENDDADPLQRIKSRLES